MLCVTGNECSLEALAQRLHRVDAQLTGTEFLQEVRLDALDGPLDDAFDLVQRYGKNLVVCCRPPSQGGRFSGNEKQRVDLLDRAARRGIAYLDLELETSPAGQAVATKHHGGKLIISAHFYTTPPPALIPLLKEMDQRGADLGKIAAQVDDAAEMRPWLEQKRYFPAPAVLIGMGLAGMLSRARYPAFGSPWTYVSAQADDRTAAGQLSLEEALTLGLPDSATAPFLALVGGPSVEFSPGPRVYNPLFRDRGLPWQYVAVKTAEGESTFDMLREMGAMGLSVTMPHKAVALAYGRRRDAAERVGSANSISFAEGETTVTNTDLSGIHDPLAAILNGRQLRDALILGSGGAARAAVAACLALHLKTTVAARRPAETAAWLPEGVKVIPFEQRHDHPRSILINATSIGGAQCPWSESHPLDAQVVFDLALSDAPSRLLRRASEEKAETIAPLEMWLAQGAKQLQWITGEDVSAEQLRAYLI